MLLYPVHVQVLIFNPAYIYGFMPLLNEACFNFLCESCNHMFTNLSVLIAKNMSENLRQEETDTSSNLDWKPGNGYVMDQDCQALGRQCDILTSVTRNHELQTMSAKQ